MTDLHCRGVRELLGVYVVGAIEPAERGVVDEHLSHCTDCREELAGLAGLPALLRRVPLADAERLAACGTSTGSLDEAPEELLTALLERVAARRRTRRVRALFATAAALVIAVSGGGLISQTMLPSQARISVTDVAHASAGGLGATVRYSTVSHGGTGMQVRVTGIQPGTNCTFWVLTRTGQRLAAGSWTVLTWAGPQSYPADTATSLTSLTGFEITSGHNVLLRIPAAA